jgi:hypothetical protein
MDGPENPKPRVLFKDSFSRERVVRHLYVQPKTKMHSILSVLRICAAQMQ